MEDGDNGGAGGADGRRIVPTRPFEIVAAWIALAVFVFCVIVYAGAQGLARLRLRPADHVRPAWPGVGRPRGLPEPRLRTTSSPRPVPIVERKSDRWSRPS